MQRDVVVRPLWDNGPVLIGGNTVYLAFGIMGSQENLSKHMPTGSVEIGDTPKLDTSIDANLAEGGNYTTIFSKVISQ